MEVMNFLRDLWEKEGHTVIIITHEMPIVAQYAQRTVVLGKGQVLMDASTREVFAEAELLARTFVKPPQITRLAQSLNEYGISNNVLTTDEMVTAFTQACEQQG
jgi:energy-coupling factor transport system ATP-binding protein